MAYRIILHMCQSGDYEIEPILVDYLRFEGAEPTVVLSLNWNEGQTHAGEFSVSVPDSQEYEQHFDLVLGDGLIVNPALARISGDEVGLRPWKDGRSDHNGKVYWSHSGVRYITGAGTPYEGHEEVEEFALSSPPLRLRSQPKRVGARRRSDSHTNSGVIP